MSSSALVVLMFGICGLGTIGSAILSTWLDRAESASDRMLAELAIQDARLKAVLESTSALVAALPTPPVLAWCAGCDVNHPVPEMVWTDAGLYRCEECAHPMLEGLTVG